MSTASKIFTPYEFTSECFDLHCCACGEEIEFTGHWGGNWEDAENAAARIAGSHTCKPTKSMLEIAGKHLKEMRSKYPFMSFDEQCDLYNKILKGHTTLTQ